MTCPAAPAAPAEVSLAVVTTTGLGLVLDDLGSLLLDDDGAALLDDDSPVY